MPEPGNAGRRRGGTVITALLIAHALAAVFMLGALTHQALSLWWPPGKGERSLFASFRAVREDLKFNTANGIFELKEHFVALGQGCCRPIGITGPAAITAPQSCESSRWSDATSRGPSGLVAGARRAVRSRGCEGHGMGLGQVLAVMVTVAALALQSLPAVAADANQQKAAVAWKQTDLCAHQALKKYPDHTPESVSYTHLRAHET